MARVMLGIARLPSPTHHAKWPSTTLQPAAGRKKRARDKAGRMASVLEGRADREEYGARAARKKQKTGSRSEREKQRSKQMPIAARIQQLRNRSTANKMRRNPKHFKGHVRGK